jgi:hypothetical protein
VFGGTRRLAIATDSATLKTPKGQPAIDAMDIPAVRPFWKAVLGYDDVTAPADLVDPSDGGPSLWFQQMDEPRPQRNRIHLDLTVPHDDAVARVEVALAAGSSATTVSEHSGSWRTPTAMKSACAHGRTVTDAS